MKTSTLAKLVLFTECIQRSTGDQCGTICDSIKGDISSSESCAKSRKSLPRPKIGRVCQEGFDEAFALTCSELCSLHGTGRHLPSYLSQACDKRKREVPRPIAHKACVEGFNAGLAATVMLISKHFKSMEEGAQHVLVEQNISRLKEAGADRNTADEVKKEEETERTKQKNEEEEEEGEQERARRVVEEKSAEVKREKEALQEKQEIEAAKDAEEAARKKREAEEERQARNKAKANDNRVEKDDETLPSSVAESTTSTFAEAAAERIEDNRTAPNRLASAGVAVNDEPGGGEREDGSAPFSGDARDEGARDEGGPGAVEGLEAVEFGAADAELLEMVGTPIADTNNVEGERHDQEEESDANRKQLLRQIVPDDDETHGIQGNNVLPLDPAAETGLHTVSDEGKVAAGRLPRDPLGSEVTKSENSRVVDVAGAATEREQAAGSEGDAVEMLGDPRYGDASMTGNAEGFEPVKLQDFDPREKDLDSNRVEAS